MNILFYKTKTLGMFVANFILIKTFIDTFTSNKCVDRNKNVGRTFCRKQIFKCGVLVGFFPLT